MTQISYDSTSNPTRHGKVRTEKTRWIVSFLRKYWTFSLFVVLPTIISAIYLFAFAADEYVSEARFTVRASNQTEAPSLLGLFGGMAGSSLANGEAFSVADYLKSHDVVTALEKQLNIVKLYRRPEADSLFRLWWSHPSQERLLDYYQRMIDITFDSQTNIATLKVYAFRREDAQKIAEKLLELGEQRVNDFSKRSEQDTIEVANREVATAEARVTKAQADLTTFRVQQQDLDPTKSAAALFGIVGGLEAQLAAARAELTAQSSYLSPSSPQYQALTQKISAIEQQIDNETALVAGNGKKALAPVLSQYERLSLEREFADREYITALASLESARLQAMKQHLFVTRVVDPNMPDQSTYPRRLVDIVTILGLLTVFYCIGWLVYAGTKEHAS